MKERRFIGDYAQPVNYFCQSGSSDDRNVLFMWGEGES